MSTRISSTYPVTSSANQSLRNTFHKGIVQVQTPTNKTRLTHLLSFASLFPSFVFLLMSGALYNTQCFAIRNVFGMPQRKPDQIKKTKRESSKWWPLLPSDSAANIFFMFSLIHGRYWSTLVYTWWKLCEQRGRRCQVFCSQIQMQI